MQDKNLFEYAVIRVVPRVEREEFLNVGVILYCARQKFLKCLFSVDNKKLAAFSPVLDLAELERNLQALQAIAAGERNTGPIGLLDLPSRFRWLTATRSTVVQTSKVHPGFCENPQERLETLFQEQVL
ncbi:MAG: DUF3037 domain-containing protein [Spirosomataceae bacterium]